MISVTDQYPGSFFKQRHRLKWRAPIVADALEKTFPLNQCEYSIVDVGCATGELIEEFLKREYNVYGIEGSEWAFKFMDKIVKDFVVLRDIREKMEIDFCPNIKFDLVLSFEVAEHIEEKSVDVYIDNLCSLGDRILITAAGPGQKGHHHVNCQPPEYWVDKFYDVGYERKLNKEQIFKEALEPWRRKRELTSYRQNCLIFESFI